MIPPLSAAEELWVHSRYYGSQKAAKVHLQILMRGLRGHLMGHLVQYLREAATVMEHYEREISRLRDEKVGLQHVLGGLICHWQNKKGDCDKQVITDAMTMLNDDYSRRMEELKGAIKSLCDDPHNYQTRERAYALLVNTRG